jgi:acetate kinase
MSGLNIQLDEQKNRAPLDDSDIARTSSATRILRISTREEQMIAREAQHLIEPLC